MMKARGRSPVLTSSAAAAATTALVMTPPGTSHSLPASARAVRPLSGGPGSNASSSGGRGSISGRSGSVLVDDTPTTLSARVPSETSSISADFLGNHEASPMHGAHNKSEALGNSIFYDEGHDVDDAAAHSGDPAMTNRAIEQIQAKIEKTKDLIKEEQTSRDDNVNEYLKLSSNADRHQQARIKQLFEKKNQKSAQSIQHLQKKLDDYQRKVQDLQEHGLRPRGSHKIGQGLKNVRDGLTGMTGSVMSKPKEFAHLLRHKFGSADNLSSISKDSDSDPTASGANSGGHGTSSSGVGGKKGPNRNHHGSASLPRENSGGGFSGSGHQSSAEGSQKGKRHSSGVSSTARRRKCTSEDGRRSEQSESVATSNSDEAGGAANANAHQMHDIIESQHTAMISSPQKASTSHPQTDFTEWKVLMTELNLHKEESDHLREEIDELRQHFKHEIEALSEQLREERDRCERLEEQMNDMTELHQHEIENIKSGVNDMEEKVQYQSEERLLDIKEHLQSLETKVTTLEHQQAQQQYLNIEGLDSSDARAILMKLLTAIITLIHVVLFFVGTAMSLAKPFFRTTTRSVVSLVVVIIAGAIYHQRVALQLFLSKHTNISPPEIPLDPGEGQG